MSRAPRTHAELTAPPPWPLSRLYHEGSKLTERRALALREQIERFSDDDGAPVAGPRAYPSRPSVELPRVRRRLLGPRLDDTLRARRSQRGPFAGGPIGLAELAALLDLSVGVTGELPAGEVAPGAVSASGQGTSRQPVSGQAASKQGASGQGTTTGTAAAPLRAYPSAGGLHPLEVYLVALACPPLSRGVYHHDAHRRVLALVAPCPALPELGRLIFADELWPTAAAALVFTGVPGRTQAKYGERGYRFVLLEAGHAAQNVLLVAASLGLAAAPIGGFCEDPLGEALGLDRDVETPVYVVVLGRR